jgi:hypothetical protein
LSPGKRREEKNGQRLHALFSPCAAKGPDAPGFRIRKYSDAPVTLITLMACEWICEDPVRSITNFRYA